jgi:diaminohydroxyphosphoribosylaminopyrimidine deaminase/5-amino-6-(5-phosphoribosylamino)uracil reductase
MQIDVEKFMRRALSLAARAKGETFPNPLVGAVVVKNGRIVGEGFHKKAGDAHAEIFALRQAGKKARGAALLCTFEPCAHFGRTGPCVTEIIKAGIKDVYVGMIDPNPVIRGRGVGVLRRAGINVKVGYFCDEISRLNEPFIKAMTKGLPFVTVKIAESLDGKTATRTGRSQWITEARTRQYAHDMRRFFDAIAVGINTVIKDDPYLEPPARFKAHRLTKVILDSGLKIPLTARLLKTRQPVIIAAVKKDPRKERRLKQMGAGVLYTRPDRGRVDLKDLLKKLNRHEIRSVLVEGGSELTGSFLDGRLADKALIFISCKFIGGKEALSSVGGRGVAKLEEAPELERVCLKRLSGDILIEGYLKYS